MKKKLLIGIALLVLASTASALAPGNLFGDQEVGKADFTAGAVDTRLGWTELLNSEEIDTQSTADNPPAIFDLTGIEPGDSGSALINVETESNSHWLKFTMDQTGASGESFYQLDLARGEVIENFSSDNLYGSRLQRAVHGSTFDSDRTVSVSSNCLDDIEIDIKNSERRANASFTVKEKCEDEVFTFASYTKLSGGGWKPGEADDQILVDYYSEVYPAGRHSISIDLDPRPHPENGVALEDNLMFQIWVDDGDSQYENDTEEIVAEGTAREIDSALGEGLYLDGGSESFLEAFEAGTTYIGLNWWVSDTCDIEGESKTFDVGFESFQERNNPDRIEGFFSDREFSLENTFRVSRDISCILCEEFSITSHGTDENVDIEKFDEENESEMVGYTTEITDGGIRFDQVSGDALGEDSEIEHQIFEVTVEDEGDLSFRIKAGPQDPVEYSLTEENLPVEVMNGAFEVELLEVVENSDGSSTYRVKVTSDDRGGKEGSYAMSFIEFNFCGDMPEFRGNSERPEKPGKPDKDSRRTEDDNTK